MGKHNAYPILILAARGDEADLILSLEMGAHDYLPKSFAARELLVRLRAVVHRTSMLPPKLRRADGDEPCWLVFGDWWFDTDGVVVSLSGAEYRLLRVFLDHPQKVLNRDQILTITRGARPSFLSVPST